MKSGSMELVFESDTNTLTMNKKTQHACGSIITAMPHWQY